MDFCRGECVTNVTTHEQMNYTASPVLFHLGSDPGEKYPIRYVVKPKDEIGLTYDVLTGTELTF